jgi:uncharacterized protein YutE (UPF0331/DUF86 family)
LTSLQELTQLTAPNAVQRDALLLRFMLTTEAVWKAAQRFLQEEHGVETGSPREAVRSSLEVGLLDGEQAEKALVLLKDRNLVVHAYTDALAEDVRRRVPEHAVILAEWLGALQGR